MCLLLVSVFVLVIEGGSGLGKVLEEAVWSGKGYQGDLLCLSSCCEPEIGHARCFEIFELEREGGEMQSYGAGAESVHLAMVGKGTVEGEYATASGIEVSGD